MRKALLGTSVLVLLTSFVFAQGILNSLPYAIRSANFYGIILVVALILLAGLAQFKFKKKLIAILLLIASCLVLLVLSAIVPFLSGVFIQASCAPTPGCYSCEALSLFRIAEAITGLEQVSLLFLILGTISFALPKDEGKPKYITVPSVLILLSLIMLLLAFYSVMQTELILYRGLVPCAIECSTCA